MSELNPYSPPEHGREVATKASRGGLLRFVLFALNSAVGLFFFAIGLAAILAPSRPMHWIVGFFVIGPTGLYAVGEFRAYFHRRRSEEVRVAWANLVCAGLFTFVWISNVIEA